MERAQLDAISDQLAAMPLNRAQPAYLHHQQQLGRLPPQQLPPQVLQTSRDWHLRGGGGGGLLSSLDYELMRKETRIAQLEREIERRRCQIDEAIRYQEEARRVEQGAQSLPQSSSNWWWQRHSNSQYELPPVADSRRLMYQQQRYNTVTGAGDIGTPSRAQQHGFLNSSGAASFDAAASYGFQPQPPHSLEDYRGGFAGGRGHASLYRQHSGGVAGVHYQHQLDSSAGRTEFTRPVQQQQQQQLSLDALLKDRQRSGYDFQVKRLLLTRDTRDRSNRGYGVGLVVEAGISQEDGRLAALVQDILPGSVCDRLRAEIGEGDQVVEWNGYCLDGLEPRELHRVLATAWETDEFEIVLRIPGSTSKQPQAAAFHSLTAGVIQENCHFDGQGLDAAGPSWTKHNLQAGPSGRPCPTSASPPVPSSPTGDSAPPKEVFVGAAEFPFERFAAGCSGADPFAPPSSSTLGQIPFAGIASATSNSPQQQPALIQQQQTFQQAPMPHQPLQLQALQYPPQAEMQLQQQQEPQNFQPQPQAVQQIEAIQMVQPFHQPAQPMAAQPQASIAPVAVPAAAAAAAAAEQFQCDTAGEISVQLYFDDYDSSVTVHIARARGLPPMDLNGLADPFVKVRLMPDPTDSPDLQRQIKYLPNTLEPDWQQTVVFMDVPKRELKNHWLDISVWDYDRLKTNDFMGRCVIRLERKLMDNQPRWYTLYAHDKEMPAPPMPPPSSSTHSGRASSNRRHKQSAAGASAASQQGTAAAKQHSKSHNHRQSKETPNANGGAAGKANNRSK